MLFFIILILTAAALQTIMNMALLRRPYRYMEALLLAGLVFIFHRYSAMVNMKDLEGLLNNYELLSAACAVVMTQSIVALLTGFSFLKYHMENRKAGIFQYAAFLPPVVFPAGAFLCLVYIFNSVGGLDFRLTALIFCAGLFIVLCAFSETADFLFGKDEEFKMEAVTLFYLFQVLTAMFIPSLVRWDGSWARAEAASFSSLLFIVFTVSRYWCHTFSIPHLANGK